MHTRHLNFRFGSQLLVAVLTTVAMSAADNPFVGDWKLSKSKSTLTDQMKVAKLDTHKYAFDFAGDGNAENIVLDGTDQPGQGGTTLAVTSEGPNAWKVVRKKDGRMLISAHWTLSEDGQTLTDNYSAIAPDGSGSPVKYVYTRHGTGSGFAGTWITRNMPVNFDLVVQLRPHEGDGLSITDSTSKLTRSMRLDGKDYPNTGENASFIATSSLRRIDAHSLELTDKRSSGSVFDTQEMKLSPDLKTLTVTQRITGRAVPSVLVFERQ
jgi:hypothetical protein